MTKHETHESPERTSASSKRARLHALLFSRAGLHTTVVEPIGRRWPKYPQFQSE